MLEPIRDRFCQTILVLAVVSACLFVAGINPAMAQEEREDKTIYKVVVNHEEQYSIWPAHKENALGWRDAGKSGTKAECLAYIKEIWTDMRPLSLRKRMEEQAKNPPLPPAAPAAEKQAPSQATKTEAEPAQTPEAGDMEDPDEGDREDEDSATPPPSAHSARAQRLTQYLVVVNHEEQYSLWPRGRKLPAGWAKAGKSGTQAQCRKYIDEVWTDVRPKSVRDQTNKALNISLRPADCAALAYPANRRGCWAGLARSGEKNLKGADLKGADLSGVSLAGADVTGAIVSRSTTRGVDFAAWANRGGKIVD